MNRRSSLPLAFLALTALANAHPATKDVSPGLCPMFIAFTAADGCSTCTCGGDARMSGCSRSACPHPGNYTINECVENELYMAVDGCNTCQCNAFRRFSWCTRKICLLSEA
ncbi:hypothetical protein R5R35_001709 [Gryllus longicercus]|uniref:Pacifastin domain-containing protein n=1 Tax=Gryllus longicercus TaxID=2509291 RepID=A0AAN9ZEY2_9ORTH